MHLQPLFGKAHPAARADVARAFSRTELDAGEVWVREGELSDTLGLVVRGKLDVSIQTSEGQLEVKCLEPGEVVGEIALFDPGPASATVSAREPSELALLSFTDLEELRVKHPRVTSNAVRVLCRKMSERLRSINDSAWRKSAAASGPSGEGGFWSVLTRWFGGGNG